MILSHKNEFCFLKTRKTGGTSAEIALSQLCGPYDVITPISANDENLRKQAYGKCAQNNQGFYNHMSLKDVEDIFPAVRSYRIVTLERHPYEKCISMALYLYPDAAADVGQMRDAVAKVLANGTYPLNWPIYTHPIYEDRVQVYTDLEDLAMGMGVKHFPRTKSLRRPENATADILSDGMKETIQHLFEVEFEMHGWGA